MMNSLFSNEDLRLIESLTYRPNLEPSYEQMKNCLVWDDERADGLSSAGYESLCDLWIARSFIHRNLSFSANELDPNYFRIIWEQAHKQKLKWPGFERLTLNEENRSYYEKKRAESSAI